MGEEEGYSSGSDSRISQQHHQLRILPSLDITDFFQKEEECNVHVPYRACQGLLFRLESYIFIDSFELNVSPIAPCSNNSILSSFQGPCQYRQLLWHRHSLKNIIIS